MHTHAHAHTHTHTHLNPTRGRHEVRVNHSRRRGADSRQAYVRFEAKAETHHTREPAGLVAPTETNVTILAQSRYVEVISLDSTGQVRRLRWMPTAQVPGIPLLQLVKWFQGTSGTWHTHAPVGANAHVFREEQAGQHEASRSRTDSRSRGVLRCRGSARTIMRP